ncbi:MAG: glycosyltransferase [Anaerovoracaceae bacterium]|jgi:dolichol-phosphate mannosyltransferase
MNTQEERTIVAILPAYNEEDNIPALLERWDQQEELLLERGLRLVVLVVNDGSGDGTITLLPEMAKQYGFMRHVSHEGNKGLGQALTTGIHYVLDNEPASVYMVVMDCDNTHDPRYVIPLVDKMERASQTDVVIASRYQAGSKISGVPFYRWILSYGARAVYTVLLSVPRVRDYTCGYRIYRTSLLGKAVQFYGDTLLEEKGFGCMGELLYKLYLYGATFDEIPFHLRYDDKLGISKMKVMNTTLQSMAMVFRLRKIRRGISNV